MDERSGTLEVHSVEVETVHQWRERRACFGELVQWDTSEHDWLEGRGEKLYPIKMIDDATSPLFCRCLRHDSTAENMRLLWSVRSGTDDRWRSIQIKASLFANVPKKQRRSHPAGGRDLSRASRRALKELGIDWIPAHISQAKGSVECSFGTDQDRLVKGLRIAGAATLEQSNAYLEDGSPL